MNKEYLCHECGAKFELPGDREPGCPECKSKEVTFEGYVEPSLFSKIYTRLRPLLNLLFFPWQYYSGREVNRSIFWLLVLISTATLLVAGAQVRQLGAGSPVGELRLVQHIPGSLPTFFRGYHRFLPGLESPGSFPRLIPGWLVVYCGLIVWELLAFVTLHSVIFFSGGQKPAPKIAAVSAGSIWIPNLFWSGLIFVLARGSALGLFELSFLSPYLFKIIFALVGLWVMYGFVGGLGSIDGIGIGKLGTVTVLGFGLQTVLATGYILLLNAVVLPFFGLAPVGGSLLRSGLTLALWPWFIPFV